MFARVFVTTVFCLIGLFAQLFLTYFWIGSIEDFQSKMAANAFLFKAQKSLANLVIGILVVGFNWLLFKFGSQIETEIGIRYLKIQILLLFLSAFALPYILL